MDPLLAALRTRAADPARATECQQAYAVSSPATTLQVLAAESRLGFRIPELLRRVYTDVGNGGFGPGYGLLGLSGGTLDYLGRDAVALYEYYRQPDPEDPHWSWPDKLLPVIDLGCAMMACVDCSRPEGPVTWFEPNPHEDGEPWDRYFIPLSASVESWLQSWLEGVDLITPAAERYLNRE